MEAKGRKDKMERYGKQKKGKKKVNEIKIFPVSFALEEIKENIAITTTVSYTHLTLPTILLV